ncbi:MAG TPA: tellurite resistance/C4-dicarboxylate transporter family protein [Trueperaceae bacterium]|nr:tellurite resistance/C4-dicarboxylate transporter family protein [Trueperaceae bacterium]
MRRQAQLVTPGSSGNHGGNSGAGPSGWRGVVAGLPPQAFALVMATGIVAIACDLVGKRGVALTLTWLNLVTYGVICLLLALRLMLYPRRALLDFADHHVGPGYFTWVAGTAVLGGQVLLLLGDYGVARVLWWVTAALWLLVTYGFFAAVTLARRKPRLDRAISGAWLLAVVATQAVALLAAQLANARPWGGDEFVFVALCLFLVGAVLYLLVIGLIFYRFTFLPLDAAQLAPPYWINMGALAITTLTGATLLAHQGDAAYLSALTPFLLGFTLLFWAFGSWWVPLLLVFGSWRHLVARYPLRYETEYWGLVFPLGMYSVASHHLAEHLGVGLVAWLAGLFAWLAAAAWTITYLAMWASGFGARSRRMPR